MLIEAKAQGETPLTAQMEQGFASRDLIIETQAKELEKFRFNDPAKDALKQHCGGMDNKIMQYMALSQLKTMFKRDGEGNWIPDPEGPTQGIHPDSTKPLDFEGAAIWLEANVPAFKLTSTPSLSGGDGEQKPKPKGEEVPLSEALKGKTDAEKRAILKARKQ